MRELLDLGLAVLEILHQEIAVGGCSVRIQSDPSDRTGRIGREALENRI